MRSQIASFEIKSLLFSNSLKYQRCYFCHISVPAPSDSVGNIMQRESNRIAEIVMHVQIVGPKADMVLFNYITANGCSVLDRNVQSLY
jgi:hypothetical protein